MRDVFTLSTNLELRNLFLGGQLSRYLDDLRSWCHQLLVILGISWWYVRKVDTVGGWGRAGAFSSSTRWRKKELLWHSGWEAHFGVKGSNLSWPVLEWMDYPPGTSTHVEHQLFSCLVTRVPWAATSPTTLSNYLQGRILHSIHPRQKRDWDHSRGF